MFRSLSGELLYSELGIDSNFDLIVQPGKQENKENRLFQVENETTVIPAYFQFVLRKIVFATMCYTLCREHIDGKVHDSFSLKSLGNTYVNNQMPW